MNWITGSDFTPRGDCGNWGIMIKNLYIWSNFGIMICYFVLPAMLMLERWRSSIEIDIKKFDKKRFYMAWAAFIVMCGAGHFFDGVLSFVWPNYRFFAVWHFGTLVVSINAIKVTIEEHFSIKSKQK